MTNSSKNSIWRLTHSLWILWTLPFGLSSWISFFYIGIRVRQMKWIISGLIYTIPLIIGMLIGPTSDYLIIISGNSGLSDLQYGFIIVIWIVSMIHAFLVRNEYLIRLEVIKEAKNTPDKYLRSKYAQEYFGNKEKTFNKLQNPFKKDKSHDEVEKKNTRIIDSSKPVDINNDPEELIAELPGVGAILAKRAVEIRKSNLFKSVYDFGETLGLKPHIIERIKPLIIINSELPKNDQNSEIHESSRLVDY